MKTSCTTRDARNPLLNFCDPARYGTALLSGLVGLLSLSLARAEWFSSDVGAPAVAGETVIDETNGSFEVKGAGTDIWGTADQFQFGFEELTGDGEIIARVVSVENANAWTKAGVMVRESLAGNARNAMLIMTPAGRLYFQRRLGTGGSTVSATKAFAGFGTWLKLVRSGNELRAYGSRDGTNWTFLASDTLAMASAVKLGLAVTSHKPSVTATAIFEDVEIHAQVEPETWRSEDVGTVQEMGSSTQPGNGQFTVKGAGADIWGTADHFHLFSQPAGGDVEVVARVTTLQNTNAWAKAGVMLRESSEPNSRYAMLAVTPGYGATFQRRLTPGGATVSTVVPGVTAPRWVKITRSAAGVTAWLSADGQSWQVVGAVWVELGSRPRAGLAVTSHASAALATATFDSVRLSSSENFQPAPVAMSEAWKQTWFGTLIVDPHGDPDGDGVPNWREFAIGASPLVGFVAETGTINLQVFRP